MPVRNGRAVGPGYGVFGQRFDSRGVAQGAEFRANTYTTSNQVGPSVASDGSGNFVVVWDSNSQDGSGYGVFGQRYDSGGVAQGAEFHVNSYTSNAQASPSVASDASGNVVVVWSGSGRDDSSGIFGQRYDSGGGTLGREFRVNSYKTASQSYPSVAADPSGNFVVVWHSFGQDGSSFGIFGQRYDSAGVAQGAEFQINTSERFSQLSPSVASDASGNVVVVWDKDYPSFPFGQRYDSEGVAQGAEFLVTFPGPKDRGTPPSLPTRAATSWSSG